MSLNPEVLIPRLGESLVSEGLLTPNQLDQALTRQKMEQEAGGAPLLGQLLISMSFISRDDLDQAVTRQIFLLHNALVASNQHLEKRVKERTHELEEAYHKLSELDQLKSNFTSNISHELRTPLVHILGYLDLFAGDKDLDLPESVQQGIDIMQHSADRLRKLIDDLILFSTSEGGNLKIQPSEYDIVAALLEIMKKDLESTVQKGVHLVFQPPERKIMVRADRRLIDWVLNQLVENAIKFTDPGGHVRLTLTRLENEVLVCIEDTGVGIDPARFDEMFQPFHQLDGSANRKQGGTGLGLAMAKRIIDAHHSELKVESTSSGSTFKFQLPFEP